VRRGTSDPAAPPPQWPRRRFASATHAQYTAGVWRAIDASLLRFSIRRLGHIPAGTTVEPAEFPEDEYPVRCLQCGYDLRRLADGRCPECGTEFRRGLLLVEEYVYGRRPKKQRWSVLARGCTGLVVASGAFPLLMAIGLVLATRVPGLDAVLLSPAACRWIESALGVCVFGVVLGNLVFLVEVVMRRPAHNKRRAVRVAARQRALAAL
jgi:hypothetical protein